MDIMCMKQKYYIPGTTDSSVIDSFIFVDWHRCWLRKNKHFKPDKSLTSSRVVNVPTIFSTEWLMTLVYRGHPLVSLFPNMWGWQHLDRYSIVFSMYISQNPVISSLSASSHFSSHWTSIIFQPTSCDVIIRIPTLARTAGLIFSTFSIWRKKNKQMIKTDGQITDVTPKRYQVVSRILYMNIKMFFKLAGNFFVNKILNFVNGILKGWYILCFKRRK